MNNGQQMPPVPPPLPQQGQPMQQYQYQQPVQKKSGGCFRYILYGILALLALVIVFVIMDHGWNSNNKKNGAEIDSVFIDKVDSIQQIASVKEFGSNMERLVLISLGNSKAENQKLVAENGIRAGKLLDSKETEWRKLYVEKLKNELWEHNVEVDVSGKTITFIGGMFADNGSIKQFQESVATPLSILGFKQVRYKWIKHADEYTYYDL